MGTFLGVEVKDWAVVISTCLGPILAVQAQKLVEGLRKARDLKVELFTRLMATRPIPARVTAEHVRALNLIDIVFHGPIRFNSLRRSKTEQDVLNTWHEYLEHLGKDLGPNPSDAVGTAWTSEGGELFINMLHKMAIDVGYDFDRALLKKGAYYPRAHDEESADNNNVRKALRDLLAGNAVLNVNIAALAGLPPGTQIEPAPQPAQPLDPAE
ncbi:DUF6680 family protein [Silvimonas soli]|uniref:DUF6680 family protein n=1 Tax=Silvimonas soli TaxID=2980100 RepID=UPI0024B32F54|nr:DUF6680 family protein [Silvimonas soli]